MSIDSLYKQYSDVHPNIVLKTDMLRRGINISRAALDNFQQRDDLLWKGMHLFSYDFQKTVVYGEKIPLMFHLEDGNPVQVRTNMNSPYTLDFRDDEFVICEDSEIIAKRLYFERKPRWYDMKLEDGTLMRAVVQGNCRLLFVTMNKYCELWNTNEQCLFCNLNATFKDQKAGAEDVVARLDSKQIAEAVKTALTVDWRYYMLYLTGGTILGRYRGQTELEFYCTRLNALREKLQVWIPTTVQIAAQNDEGWKELHETGFGSVQPNIEVWDRRLFKWICPGKDKFIGYDEWIKRTIRAADFWGPGRVNPNFVLGVEMAEPYGFENVSSAVKSTASGWDFLMSHDVLPRYSIWTIEPGSAFADRQVPPLEYFIEVQKVYTELRWKYNFDPPFPATQSFYDYYLCSLQDFEYYHGTGTVSKRTLDARLGLAPDDIGGSYREGGYTVY
jgi:hypothetical protein